MARKTECYVDTSAFIAFLDRSDSHHLLFRRLFAKPPRLVTSSLVVAEGHGWFLRRFDQGRAIQFLNFIADLAPLQIEPFDETQVRTAAQSVRKFSDQPLTLADAHGLSIMKEHRTAECWSTDRHMTLSGVPLVR
ncbi:MAG: PIN domain-containing protein [Bryobacteraceae bacterium]